MYTEEDLLPLSALQLPLFCERQCEVHTDPFVQAFLEPATLGEYASMILSTVVVLTVGRMAVLAKRKRLATVTESSDAS